MKRAKRTPGTSPLAVLAVAVLALAAGAPPATAQEDPAPADRQQADRPDYVVVTWFEVAPPDADAFRAAVRDVRQTAVDAGIPSDFRWDIYARDNTYVFVSWREAMADFDDPDAFMRQFEGEHAERLGEIFESFGDVQATALTNVLRPRPDWSHTPDETPVTMGQHAGVFVISHWPGRTTPDAFEASAKRVVAFVGEVGYPYPVQAYQVMLGDEHVEFVIPFDDPAELYGANALQPLVEAAGRADEWEGILRDHRALLADMDSQILFYLPDLSYRPDLQVASEGGDAGG